MTADWSPHDSHDRVALSHRAAGALDDLSDTGPFGHAADPAGYVFHRHGRPLCPEHVLDRFHLLCDKARAPAPPW